MKRKLLSFIFAWSILYALPLSAGAEQLLIPVGRIIGITVSDDTLTVAAFDDTCGAAARDAGLKIGDRIEAMEGIPVTSATDIKALLKNCGEDIELTVIRGSKKQTLRLQPQQTAEGPRLGVYLRQGIAGIGTVTFYDPDTKTFGSLGHGVNDPRGALLPLKSGSVYEASVQSVRKGCSGDPGQLRGCAEAGQSIGQLKKNTPQGIFGTAPKGWPGEPLPVAAYSDVHTGKAMIRSTVAGETVQEYSVEILKIYPQDRPDCRNFLIKVTDPALLTATGGIVQGMSGSPIIQDGKLVGAVTHVLVNDPTTGYGIFIENMLDAAA